MHIARQLAADYGNIWLLRAVVRPFKWHKFKRSLHKLNCVVLDVETGGLDEQACALLAIGAINVREGFPTSKFEVSIKPDANLVVDTDAVKINGGINDHGVDEREALEKFIQFVKTHEHSRRVLAIMGHNVSFDINFMSAAGRRQSLPWRAFRLSHRLYDTCTLACIAELQGTIQSRSLDNICRDFKLYGKLNRASLGHKSPLNDCEATLAIFYELLWRAT